MIFRLIFELSVTCYCLINAAIIVQAPKYVPKHELLSLVQKYYQILENHRTLSPNKDIEIELPVPWYVNQQYRPMKSRLFQHGKNNDMLYAIQNDNLNKAEDALSKIQFTEKELETTKDNDMLYAIQNDNLNKAEDALSKIQFTEKELETTKDNDMLYAIQNDNLNKAEDALSKIQFTEKELETTKVEIPSTPSPPDLKKLTVYQEDVQRALDELNERLKAGGNRLATVEDLKTSVNELEKKLLEKPKAIERESITPSLCGKEQIMHEALKPVLKEDLKDIINLNLSHAVEVPSNTGEETLSPIEIIIIRAPPKKGPDEENENQYSVGQEIIDLLEDGVTIEKQPLVLEDNTYIPIIRIPSTNPDSKYIDIFT